jgi:hypothetical protein
MSAPNLAPVAVADMIAPHAQQFPPCEFVKSALPSRWPNPAPAAAPIATHSARTPAGTRSPAGPASMIRRLPPGWNTCGATTPCTPQTTLTARPADRIFASARSFDSHRKRP